MNKKFKIALIVVVIFILTVGAVFIGLKMIKKAENREPTVQTKVTNEIENYDYTLDDRDSDLFKAKFDELKEVLDQDNVDQNKYLSLISEMFVIDYYSLDNKISKYDVGGLEFLHSASKESFTAKSLNTVYKYVNDNSYGDRVQELPKVTEAKTLEIKESTYNLNGKTENSYVVSVEFDYELDLGYPKKASITYLKEDNKFAIIAYE